MPFLKIRILISSFLNKQKKNQLALTCMNFYRSESFILFYFQLRLFSQQLQHRTPVATCGLFPFDWTLLYSVSFIINS